MIHSLLFHDKQQRATVAVHVRWLERFLAAFEKQLAGYFKRWMEVIHNDGRKNDDFLKRALRLQSVYSFPPLNELPNEGEGLHCPLPPVPDQDHLNNELRNPMINKVLLHLISYLYPLVSGKGSRGEAPVELSGSLSRSQLAAIHYVNDFVTSRYPSLSMIALLLYTSSPPPPCNYTSQWFVIILVISIDNSPSTFSLLACSLHISPHRYLTHSSSPRNFIPVIPPVPPT